MVSSHRVKYILNISREIDNFYPEEFKYLNIRQVDTSVWTLGDQIWDTEIVSSCQGHRKVSSVLRVFTY